MKFAILNGIKTEAKPNLTATCPVCSKPVRSYCGNQVIHHWKHIKLSECDDWYERETEWHREWKNHFSTDYQEVIRYDSNTNEKHIADIYNKEKDVVIEIQHSPIDTEEIQARELFYDRMIWIIDLIPIKKNLDFIKSESKIQTILNKMSNNLPKNFKVSDDFELDANQKEVVKFIQMQGLNIFDSKESMYLIKLEKRYTSLCNKKDYFFMTWKNLHKRWDFSKKPKFIDIGTNDIFQLIERVETGNAYIVKKHSKAKFINHYK